MFKDPKLGKAYEYYISMRNFLAATDSAKTKTGAIELNALKDAKAPAASIEAATRLANAAEMEEQHQVFSTLSNEMTSVRIATYRGSYDLADKEHALNYGYSVKSGCHRAVLIKTNA